MPTRATVRMMLTLSATRVLMTDRYGREVLKAQLPAASQAHRLATRTLLEGLALFCDARLLVVLFAESEETSCAQGLHWSEIIARTIARGEEVGSFLKGTAKATWQLANWLTHARNAVRMDGQIALNATNVVLGTFAMTLVRHEQGAPERCPSCSSYQVDLDFRMDQEADDLCVTFSVCARCGWEPPLPGDAPA